MPITRMVQKVFRSQALRFTALALVLPTLLMAPGQAGMLLLHRHCDESTHFHRFHHTDLGAWHEDHARQHDCEGPGHRDSHDSESAVADAECDHDSPLLVLPLSEEYLSRPLRLSGSAMLSLSLTMSPAAVALPTAPEHPLSGEPPPPRLSRADLSTLDATAALLLRNHALLL